jgi:hypothetical protein
MLILHKTNCMCCVGWCESAMIRELRCLCDREPELRSRCTNIRLGGDGTCKGGPPFFLYAVLWDVAFISDRIRARKGLNYIDAQY